MKVAAIQFACSQDVERNIDTALRIARVAANEGASVICFAELFCLPWFPAGRNESHFGFAQTVDGVIVQSMKGLAREAGAVVLAPFFEADGSRCFNSCAVIDADGSLTGVYRKMHVPDIPLWEESFYFSPGDLGFPVFQTQRGRLGVQTAWDNLYPEGSRLLALGGADIIFAPTACAFQSQQLWQTVVSANAVANGVYAVRVNRAGSEPVQDFYGMSFCVDPEGEIIGGPTSAAHGVMLADIDFAYLEQVRREWPIMKGRRPLDYGGLCKVEL
jgi:N-carbamoylputrescine amidase